MMSRARNACFVAGVKNKRIQDYLDDLSGSSRVGAVGLSLVGVTLLEELPGCFMTLLWEA